MMKPRSFVLYFLLVCFVYGTIEVMSYLGLLVLHIKRIDYSPQAARLSAKQIGLLKKRLKDDPPLRGHHPLLGWAPKPYMNEDGVRINSQRIRGEHDYAYTVNNDVVRVAAFGDSFTFGDEVANEETWEHQLEQQDPRFELLNFGMGAYGLDQAFLRYRHEGISFNPDIVIIGYMTENIHRNLNVFRPFYHSSYANNLYTKPRFLLEDGELVLLSNPLTTAEDYARFANNDELVLQELGTHDYFYYIKYRAGPLDWLPSVRLAKITSRYVKERLKPVLSLDGTYAVSSEAFDLTTTIFDEFYCAALEHQSLPVILIFPALTDFNRHRTHQSKQHAPLIDHFRAKGYRYVDVLDHFVAEYPDLPLDQLTVGKWGHYSGQGNAIVADAMQAYFHEEQLYSKSHLRSLIDYACSAQQCCPGAGS